FNVGSYDEATNTVQHYLRPVFVLINQFYPDELKAKGKMVLNSTYPVTARHVIDYGKLVEKLNLCHFYQETTQKPRWISHYLNRPKYEAQAAERLGGVRNKDACALFLLPPDRSKRYRTDDEFMRTCMQIPDLIEDFYYREPQFREYIPLQTITYRHGKNKG